MLKNLIAWEQENGYKAKFVAEKLGLTQVAYAKIKKGKQKPPLTMAEKLRTEFGIKDPFTMLKNF